MSNNWIFVLTEYSNYNYGSVKETVEILKRRLKWRIGLRTPNRYKLKEDDKAVFYVTGDDNRYFLGKTELNSAFLHEGDPIYGHVLLKQFHIFKDPIYIKPFINQLNFIKNKKYWGVYFQGGIININFEDFNTILKGNR